MGELSIKIKIADREYPMRIDSSEEERLRIAGKIVNEKMKQYRQQFGIDDKQDLLAMVAFDSLVEKLKVQEGQGTNNQHLQKYIVELDQVVTKALDT